MSFDREKVLKFCNDWCKNTLMETLEIEYIDAGTLAQAVYHRNHLK